MYSHALLLRLFLSNSFFSVHVALQYLRLYAHNIGITHYLTSRLKELPAEELWDVWGFICHLVVSQPTKSVALECFIVERAEHSTHIAMLTFWFMRAALSDLALTRRDTPSFMVCQRILHKCHEIIFGDLPPPIPAPYGSLTVHSISRFLRRKVKARLEPTLVGIGCVLAGVPGMPRLAESTGKVAVEQGRWEDGSARPRGIINVTGEDAAAPQAQESQPASVVDDVSDDDCEGGSSPDGFAGVGREPSNKSSSSLVADKAYRRRARPPNAAQTTPALLMHAGKITRPSDDPLGQLDDPSPPPSHHNYRSTPAFSDARRPQPFSPNSPPATFLLQKYDPYSQSQLLRSHYLRGEIQFILALETIANRLLVVPRPARVSALRAELTNLNHKLPAEVCIPLWCHTSDAEATSTGGQLEPHHRVVRIPPGESVVLNSAERAPYLLIVEILHNDLDFDPLKKENTEVLRKMALKEIGHQGGLSELPDWSTGPNNALSSMNPRYDAVQEVLDVKESGDVPTLGIVVPPTPLDLPEEEEEVDVVEQLYGADLSLRSQGAALNDSIALPAVRKNKVLDMEVWSKSTSAPSSPALGPQSSASLDHIRTLSEPRIRNTSSIPSDIPLSSSDATPHSNGRERVLSLEDYSERMRAAAVMLAQLNANVVREPVTTIAVPNTLSTTSESNEPISAFSWIPGSSWLPGIATAGFSGQGSEGSQPVMRMRLQRSEAKVIRDRIMEEMLALEEERMDRMRAPEEGGIMNLRDIARSSKTMEDESIIRRELNRDDPSAAVFRESWATKKKRIKAGSPYGHLANWDCVSLIVKTGADLRQEQLAVQLIQEFGRIWKDEMCSCWVRHFRILITGPSSGLVETITDAVSIHSLKKAEYARRLAEGRLGYVTLLDYFISAYGDPSSAKFARAQRNFAQSLAGYSLVTYLLQIKDRHNGNILLDRDGHLLHIDFGFMLSNSPGNIGFEAAPFKLPSEYVEVLGGIDGEPFQEFKRLFREGFEATRKHCDRIITHTPRSLRPDSNLPCFAAFREQTAEHLRDRFQPALTHSLVGEHIERLIVTSLGSAWTRLYDSYQYYSQSIL
ncbi:kinase-like protein [Hysterangium stoloniferum]|nr:kinase-like protein [Hysterangium stoloniferum]